MEVPWNFRFGIVILGDSAVGKSSLLHRFTEGTFDDSRQSPLGIDFKVYNIHYDPDVVIKLLLWDTAGQERFRSICKSYMRNSVGCILMFDVSQRQTFDRIGSWHREVLDYVKPNPMFFLLVGHKSDLAVGRQVRKSEGEALAKKLNMIAYLEVSTKENLNVSEAFETLTRGIYNLFQKGKITPRDDWHGLTVGATVDKEPQVAKKSNCCNFG
ncbi:ras-related protein Rab-39A [Triplophysa rosa]|uniref:Ras-related protein Rab-39A-like n=1 Tax=Triplophysa rosa TaxID=992332 RepID=A0A9W7WMT7_TRIRA|nr:ras-related protein Rab-39A [Triplophysa rosa]KAI7805069.1 putative ras-related protein Rab-39A-like [Triplophysa rosa]